MNTRKRDRFTEIDSNFSVEAAIVHTYKRNSYVLVTSFTEKSFKKSQTIWETPKSNPKTISKSNLRSEPKVN